MENVLEQSKEEEQIELAPGFRFHPTDEELITHYLSPKVVDNCFCSIAIGEVDLNKCEPWDLPRRAKMGEKQWYFFCVRDRKYPTGLRTNRATDAGYWKATGKDKVIYKMKTLVGMKKTLVFYKGRAPKGVKTNWVMHEYRLEGKFSLYNLPESTQNEWVICRVFQKISCEKKSHFSELIRFNSCEVSHLPPLKDSSPVSCFSNATENQSSERDTIDTFKNPISFQNTFYTSQFDQNIENLQRPNSDSIQDQSILRILLENQNLNMKQSPKSDYLHETRVSSDVNSIMSYQSMNPRSTLDHEALCTSTPPIIDIDSFWNY